MVNHSAGNLSSFLDRPIFFSLFSPLGREQKKKKEVCFSFAGFLVPFTPAGFFLYQKKLAAWFFPHYKHLKHYRGGDPIWLVDLNEVLPKKSWPTPRHIWDKGRLGGGGAKQKGFYRCSKDDDLIFFPIHLFRPVPNFFFVWFTDFYPPLPPQMFQTSLVGARGRLLCILKILRVIRYFYFNFLITRLGNSNQKGNASSSGSPHVAPQTGCRSF